MKKILALMLFAVSAQASGTHLAQMEPDQDSYLVGSRAVIFIPMKRPATPGTEFFLEIEGNPTGASVTALTPDLAVAVSSRFSTPEANEWRLKVFQQNRKEHLALEKGVAFYASEITRLKLQWEKETNQEARNQIQAEMDSLNEKKEFLKASIKDRRTLVDQIYAQSFVTTAFSRIGTKSGLLTIRADRNPANYLVGEAPVFFATPLVSFKGPDGVRENVLRGSFLGNVIHGSPVATEISFALPTLSGANQGVQSFRTDFYIRSKRQADRLRAAVGAAITKKTDYQDELSRAASPQDRTYWEMKIAELEAVKSALLGQLEEILILVDSAEMAFQVNP